MARCSNCGNEVAAGKKFCRNCGAPMIEASEEATTWRLPPNTAPTPDPPRPTMPVGAAQTAPPNQPANPIYVPPQADFYAPPPSPVPYQPPAQSGPAHISLGDWLSGGWQVYKENWLLMSLASVLGLFLGTVTAGIMAGPLLMGMFRMAFKTMRGERPQLGDMFTFEGRFLQSFLAFLIAAAIYAGLLGGGSNAGLFVVLKFIITPLLTMMLGLTMPLILERRMDVVKAINEVGHLIFSRDALMWWVVGLVFATISTGGVVGCGIGLFVTLPWMISSAAVAYRDVFGIDDPNRTLH